MTPDARAAPYRELGAAIAALPWLPPPVVHQLAAALHCDAPPLHFLPTAARAATAASAGGGSATPGATTPAAHP